VGNFLKISYQKFTYSPFWVETAKDGLACKVTVGGSTFLKAGQFRLPVDGDRIAALSGLLIAFQGFGVILIEALAVPAQHAPN
jgi:hypothetical protein